MSNLQENFQLKRSGVAPEVTFNLDPGESIIAHPGALKEMSDHIDMDVRFFTKADSQKGLLDSLWGLGKRAYVHEGLSAVFTNNSSEVADVVLHPPGGGCVAWLHLNKTGNIVCRKGALSLNVQSNSSVSKYFLILFCLSSVSA